MIVRPSQCDYTDKDLLAFLGNQESQDIRWGDEYEDALIDQLKTTGQAVGARLPWGETHDLIRFRGGEVTIHAGMNGHRKSMVTGQIAQWFALAGEPVGIMSFEMRVPKTMERMVRQAAGSHQPSEAFTRQWARWNHQNIAYYDKLDTTPSQRVLGAAFYFAKDLGCKHLFIDSLTKCGLPYGERGAEKDFIDALCATAKAFDIHIHLICHVRKPHTGGQGYIPTKFDVRGAGELTDLVHNVIIHWADKKKIHLLDKQSQGGSLSQEELDYLKRPDQRLIVEKQRDGEYEGTIGLNMHPSLQFYKGRKLTFDFPHMEATA